MNKIFGYARVSTVDQKLDTQIDTLTKYGCHQIFQDKISGTTSSRPALDDMLSRLREGDTVVVARLNRLGRSLVHIITLVAELASKGIHFKALDLGIDTSTPAGKMILSVFASLAEYERETILEKTKAGQKLAIQQGKHVGRPKGFNQEMFSKVKTATERGMSISEIVKLTGISRASVTRYRRLISPKMSTAIKQVMALN